MPERKRFFSLTPSLSVEVLLRKQFGSDLKKSGIDLFRFAISTPWPAEGVAVTIPSCCVDTTS